jgi:hypothetical protein
VGQRPTLGLSCPTQNTLTTLVAGRALHCGRPLDEIGRDTWDEHDSGDADGTIVSRVALGEFEVDRLCGSRPGAGWRRRRRSTGPRRERVRPSGRCSGISSLAWTRGCSRPTRPWHRHVRRRAWFSSVATSFGTGPTNAAIGVLSAVAGPAARILSPSPNAANGAIRAGRLEAGVTGFDCGAGAVLLRTLPHRPGGRVAI